MSASLPFGCCNQNYKVGLAPRLTPQEDRVLPQLKLHHIGVAVSSIDDALALYEDALGLTPTTRVAVAAEQVNVAMLPLGEPRIELLEATSPDSPIARFLTRRGPGVHHIAIEVPDLEATVARLKASGRRLVSDEIRQGAEGYRYVFVHPSGASGVLLELIEVC
jgi:methylmalonyl-CoA epimerase